MHQLTGRNHAMPRTLRLLTLCCTLAACSSARENQLPVLHAPSPVGSSKEPGALGAEQSGTQTKEVQRTLVAHGDLADRPGFESRLYLVEYPPGVEAGAHTHTEQCVGYVLEGRFASAYGDGPISVKQAGEGFVDLPSGAHHFKNLDPARPLRFLVTGTFRKEEPLLRPVSDATGFAPGAAPAVPEAAALPPFGPVTEVKRSLLVQQEISDLPGMESRIYLMEFPPGAASKLHLHTTQGIGYVLEGSFESAFGDEHPTVKRAGEGFVDVPNRPHHFRNPAPDRPLRFVFAGTFHKDEPLFQILPQ
jgi:quercetin dioxygenase-like cupin family protein